MIDEIFRSHQRLIWVWNPQKLFLVKLLQITPSFLSRIVYSCNTLCERHSALLLRNSFLQLQFQRCRCCSYIKSFIPCTVITNGVSLSVGVAPHGECDRQAAGSFWVFKSRVFWTEFIQTIIQYVKNVIDTSDLYVIHKKKSWINLMLNYLSDRVTHTVIALVNKVVETKSQKT